MEFMPADAMTRAYCWIARINQFVIDTKLDRRLNRDTDELVKLLTTTRRAREIQHRLNRKEYARLVFLTENLEKDFYKFLQENYEEGSLDKYFVPA